MRRRPNPTQRRHDLCDAAIALLAAEGSKGLSHLKVDRWAGVPDGTTSFHFRTRSALLRAIADRLDELDMATMQTVVVDGSSSSTLLAELVMRAGVEPQLTRTRARYELTMQATRDPQMAESLQRSTQAFTTLHHEILAQLLPEGAELSDAVISDLSTVMLTFINGLLLRFAHGDRVVDSVEELDRMMSAIAAGFLHADHPARF
ncbi:TetR family transcriptional regulator C-terminal domain-containing protein [Mycolicibacterium sp. S2-37]|uniref:TetR/AcrR family transcriptional regulator n=1 Tax=Mycolicibacterium sp. S2-37 TaxID=2810297 RepID=UPI001A94A5AA|nr:TetR family transcriptional regulator C-terminal domain-containing protein [Mycolicibacterium sp. S2-37]MBO0680838.1 TetR family transcriptional regulator C-terminal domain-containing protein [Mycolicibacterium sp. S2-37]